MIRGLRAESIQEWARGTAPLAIFWSLKQYYRNSLYKYSDRFPLGSEKCQSSWRGTVPFALGSHVYWKNIWTGLDILWTFHYFPCSPKVSGLDLLDFPTTLKQFLVLLAFQAYDTWPQGFSMVSSCVPLVSLEWILSTVLRILYLLDQFLNVKHFLLFGNCRWNVDSEILQDL